ncbi:MAG: metallophosphoesterase [Chlorobi bacterium]|nr:metallophosphoesterase [Chlorobiota bacterium]
MRIVAISDTHNRHDDVTLPDGDILIHAGDCTGRGTIGEVRMFLEWFGSQSHRIKLFVAGNHDFLFQCKPAVVPDLIAAHAPGVIHLCDSAATVHGLTIHGSPWTPWFHDWAFNAHRGRAIRRYWKMIPKSTDILVTHGPPEGIADLIDGRHVGCADLRKRIDKLSQLRAHIFGHIHSGYGATTRQGIQYINASICNERYQPVNAPIVIGIDSDLHSTRVAAPR